MIQFEHIITILAVVGSALTVYFNLKKFGDNIKQEAEWRTGVNLDMKNLLEKVSELLAVQKDTAKLVQELMEFKINQGHVNDRMDKEFATIWKRMDENKQEIATLKKYHME